jgi:glyoxylase-like metal-dependent hydrolase (beta-lactamase superfamily II)
MTESEEFVPQIAKMGLKPKDLKAVILTHSHMDHAGAIEHFANTGVPIILQKKEYEWTKKWVDSGKKTLTPLDDPAIWKQLNWKQIEGVYDVFGDGAVVLIPTPGHTVGSQSILVRVCKGGKEIKSAILLGDAMYTMENLEAWIQAGYPQDPAAFWLSAENMKLWHLMGFYLVPGHDDGFFARCPLAPWPMFE